MIGIETEHLLAKPTSGSPVVLVRSVVGRQHPIQTKICSWARVMMGDRRVVHALAGVQQHPAIGSRLRRYEVGGAIGASAY